ncbi:MAG: flavodoxin-dependent (E)-4-hydroxy-3-methylbut-2-enyl-diphosphate synthase, partial [Flavobacterium sp.]|nr:flavodoxin-dependent (E)-4-hydroxy-3-methylbut-2-enyl-diphosphate synthase [Flavobacterium sp.]
MTNELPFSADYFSYQRLKTKEVKIGSIVIGGNFPIAVQSMTNTSTLDTKSTVEQCIRIINAGGELVRITAQGVAEAKNLKNIKAELIEKGYDTPIVADIHFQPKAAEIAAQYVDK